MQEFRAREDPEDYVALPYLRDAAAAGKGLIMEDDIAGYVVAHRRVVHDPEHYRCVRIEGESMAPTLPSNSIVAIDLSQRDPRACHYRIVCARTPIDEVVVKRMMWQPPARALVSDSADQASYPVMTITQDWGEDWLIGRVVWAWVDLSD